MTPVERLIATARAEVGYLEKASNSQLDSKTGNAGYNNFTKYARDLDRLGVYNGPKMDTPGAMFLQTGALSRPSALIWRCS